jgi:hypothetical protein
VKLTKRAITLFFLILFFTSFVIGQYKGDWKDGRYHGKGIFIDASGGRYEGDFVKSKKHGYGMQYYSNGAKFEGEWIRNKKSNGTYYFSNLKKEIWVNGSPQDKIDTNTINKNQISKKEISMINDKQSELKSKEQIFIDNTTDNLFETYKLAWSDEYENLKYYDKEIIIDDSLTIFYKNIGIRLHAVAFMIKGSAEIMLPLQKMTLFTKKTIVRDGKTYESFSVRKKSWKEFKIEPLQTSSFIVNGRNHSEVNKADWVTKRYYLLFLKEKEEKLIIPQFEIEFFDKQRERKKIIKEILLN